MKIEDTDKVISDLTTIVIGAVQTIDPPAAAIKIKSAFLLFGIEVLTDLLRKVSEYGRGHIAGEIEARITELKVLNGIVLRTKT